MKSKSTDLEILMQNNQSRIFMNVCVHWYGCSSHLLHSCNLYMWSSPWQELSPGWQFCITDLLSCYSASLHSIWRNHEMQISFAFWAIECGVLHCFACRFVLFLLWNTHSTQLCSVFYTFSITCLCSAWCLVSPREIVAVWDIQAWLWRGILWMLNDPTLLRAIVSHIPDMFFIFHISKYYWQFSDLIH